MDWMTLWSSPMLDELPLRPGLDRALRPDLAANRTRPQLHVSHRPSKSCCITQSLCTYAESWTGAVDHTRLVCKESPFGAPDCPILALHSHIRCAAGTCREHQPPVRAAGRSTSSSR